MISRFTTIAIIVIVIVSTGVYLNTLLNDFVYDDLFQVLENKWIRDIRNIPVILTSSLYSFEKWTIPHDYHRPYYRPMMHLIYMIEYHIFGLKPWGWHLVNVIFHSGVTVLVFLVAYNFFSQSAVPNPKSQILNPESEILYPAFIAGLLFATYPIHTEAVAWIGGIPELSFTLFYLLSLYLYIQSRTTNDQQTTINWSYLLAIISYFFSLLSKESAITLPLLLIFYDHLVRKELITPLWPWIKRYMPYMGISIIYLLLRLYALGDIVPLRQEDLSLNFIIIINAFPLLTGYFKKLFFPIHLNAFYTFHPVYSVLEIKTLFSLMFTLVLISFLYWSKRANEKICFSLLWIIIPLIPVLYIPVLGKNPFAERYLYLPSAGFVILVAMVLKKINRISLPFITIGIILALYSTVTIERNSIWRNEYTLWKDTVKKSPDSSTAHYNLGIVYAEKKLFDRAIDEFKEAIKISPKYEDAYYNLGLMYDEKGFTELAIAAYKMTLSLNPKSADAHYNLGLIYLKKLLYDQALSEFQEAIRIKPDYSEAQKAIERVLSLKIAK